MKPTFSSLSKPVRYLLVSTFVVVFVCVTFQLASSKFHSISSVSELERVFAGITLPADAVQVGEVSVSSKVTAQTVYANFHTGLSGAQIEEFFRAQLEPIGWRQIERRSKDSTQVLVKYCRGGIVVGFEANDSPPNGSRFFLFVNRGFEPAFASACK